MRVAVTYLNGDVFPHFGKTESFKIYEVEDKKILSSEVISSNGAGHGALANVLKEANVDVLICGGLGGGALTALTEAGIEVIAGASGNTDEAVESYLKGELVSTGANCDHHSGEDHACGEHGCGHHEEESECGSECGEEECSGSCGSCSGCGGTPEVIYEGKNAGKTVSVHYRGTLNDGTQFDSSYDRGQTLDYLSGVGMMIPGFDKAVVNMEVGEKVTIHLSPEEAYGMPDENNIIKLKIKDLPGSEDLEVGHQAYLQNAYGGAVAVRVVDKTEEEITFDANHELAGKELNFEIELVSVKED
ncbi:NifB/NifX family molybdenum-iron cluster-binding protein [Lachnospira multipara]|uniref:NifB/NifX family molybdenum-iron cluster-binding protein n=1 Tax=Lachnospira multipara TaxID=28051 RepID=UPI0004E20876|nr:NifB/NifX family molybdenum-iron cluster-binding protein [Lachnospira multipara]